jgi:hypothetical protein
MDPVCTCGHIFDEHKDGGPCEAEIEFPPRSGLACVCICAHFEEDD